MPIRTSAGQTVEQAPENRQVNLEAIMFVLAYLERVYPLAPSAEDPLQQPQPSLRFRDPDGWGNRRRHGRPGLDVAQLEEVGDGGCRWRRHCPPPAARPVRAEL